MIGIIDWDLLSTKRFCNYNFGVLLVSSYYLEQGVKCRLILNTSYENLQKYKKIYIFKDYKTLNVPINTIKRYMSLPIEEYGEGFADRPLIPDLPEIIYTKVNTDIYKPILYYIQQGGKNFSIDPKWRSQFFPSKLFFEREGELLLREEGLRRYMYIYDDPLLFFNTALGKEMMAKIKKHSIIRFVKPVCISKIEPENWEWLFNNAIIGDLKKNLYALEEDVYWKEFYQWFQTHDISGDIKIVVKTKTGDVKTLNKKGGKIYGDYGIERNDERTTNYTSSKKDIPVGYEWVTTKRYNESNQRSRKRARKTQRSKYLPSEQAKRRRRARWKYDAIRSGKWR